MSKKTIMLICQGGMSTSVLVKKMEDAAKLENVDVEIFAIGTGEVRNKLENRELDAILLGPQVRFLKKDLEKQLDGKDIYLDIIAPQDYGLMNGEKILKGVLPHIS